ncbi:MAG: flagellar biosynthesis anti-sigma factor FlgM [Gammaproteobacteria bacterium]|nr:flagellar biosynthesis anti-sigma factor FlgM [Gammaproteobacteria bacterium]
MKNTLGSSGKVNNYIGFPVSERQMGRRDLSLRHGERQTARNMAEQLQQMEQYVTGAPVVDFHKRNAIRNAIVNGYYVIDPVSIAEKFLKFERNLYR